MHAATRNSRNRSVQTYAVVVAMVSVAAVFVTMAQGSSKTLVPPAEEYTEVVVLQGDTLWHIARRHAAPGTDIRKMVDAIREANDLNSAVVVPGQVLKVPVQ